MNRHIHKRSAHREGGFTLVELMVTVAIAMFLLAGLVTIVENIRISYLSQEQLVQLQDEQRFAITVLTDAVQAAGYFSNATADTTSAFPTDGANGFGAGWVFAGSHAVGVADAVAQDTLTMRFQSGPLPDGSPSYGPVLCNGTDTSNQAQQIWNVTFSLNPATNELQCAVNGGNPVVLLGGVQGLAVYYGVKRNGGADFNVDTYETWDVMNAAGDWLTVSAVRVVITFINPVKGPSQPATITVERVIQVMGRGGAHT